MVQQKKSDIDKQIINISCALTSGNNITKEDIFQIIKIATASTSYGCNIPLVIIADSYSLLKNKYVEKRISTSKTNELIMSIYDRFVSEFSDNLQHYIKIDNHNYITPAIVLEWLNYQDDTDSAIVNYDKIYSAICNDKTSTKRILEYWQAERNLDDWFFLNNYKSLFENYLSTNQAIELTSLEIKQRIMLIELLVENTNQNINDEEKFQKVLKEWHENSNLDNYSAKYNFNYLYRKYIDSKQEPELKNTQIEQRIIEIEFLVKDRNQKINETVHEDFDYDAANIYLSAPKLNPSASQTNKLRLIERPVNDSYYTDAYETLNPYNGALPRFLLTEGELGESKIINRSHIYISSEDSNPPEKKYDIFFLWICAYRSISSTLRHASILQSAISLIVNDCREILCELPVTFHIHRLWPPNTPLKVNSGKSWKANTNDNKSHMPKDVVDSFFKLINYNEVIDTVSPIRQKFYNNTKSILFLLECDLNELGFEEISEKEKVKWNDINEILPKITSCVIILNGDDLTYNFYKVDKHQLLEQNTKIKNEISKKMSLLSLRSQVLDKVIELMSTQ